MSLASTIRYHARGPYADWYLAGTAFAESSFFIVPPDVILVAILLSGATRWLYYASVTTLASVAGGLFGYLIGYLAFTTFGAPLVNLYHLQEEFAAVENYFSSNAFWSILVAAFTPIPYKVFTLAAGLFRVNIWTFVLASLVGRGARFFAVAYLTKRFGERVMQLVLRYVNAVILILVFLFLVYFFFLR